MIIEITVNGARVQLIKHTLDLTSRLGNRVSVAKFAILGEEAWVPADVAASCGGGIVADGGYIQPDIKTEVQINNIADPVQYLSNFFGGYVSIVEFRLARPRIIYYCTAQDFNSRLHFILVDESYAAQTEQQIIDDLFGTYWSDIDTATYVVSDNTLTIEFPRLLFDEALNQLAKINEKEWYIDGSKRLHYFTPSAGTAPFEIRE